MVRSVLLPSSPVLGVFVPQVEGVWPWWESADVGVRRWSQQIGERGVPFGVPREAVDRLVAADQEVAEVGVARVAERAVAGELVVRQDITLGIEQARDTRDAERGGHDALGLRAGLPVRCGVGIRIGEEEDAPGTVVEELGCWR